MSFERGSLVLVPFPFTDLTAAKQRPVLALTAPDVFDDFIGLPVTTRPQEDHGVALTVADLLSGSLPRSSWIRINRPVSLSQSLVIKSIARVSGATVDHAARRLCAYLSTFS